MSSCGEGTNVEWDWGDGSASGKIAKVCTRKISLTIKGSDVTRDASKGEPAYRVEQADGGEVLKSHSEVRKPS